MTSEIVGSEIMMSKRAEVVRGKSSYIPFTVNFKSGISSHQICFPTKSPPALSLKERLTIALPISVRICFGSPAKMSVSKTSNQYSSDKAASEASTGSSRPSAKTLMPLPQPVRVRREATSTSGE